MCASHGYKINTLTYCAKLNCFNIFCKNYLNNNGQCLCCIQNEQKNTDMDYTGHYYLEFNNSSWSGSRWENKEVHMFTPFSFKFPKFAIHGKAITHSVNYYYYRYHHCLITVSVCQNVSTMAHFSLPTTRWYHNHASGLMGSPTVPSTFNVSRLYLQQQDRRWQPSL